jgi:hypothetical protein
MGQIIASTATATRHAALFAEQHKQKLARVSFADGSGLVASL